MNPMGSLPAVLRLCLACGLPLLAIACGPDPDPGPDPVEISFNEIMASNLSAYADSAGEYDDWLELYNAGATAVNLEGYYLSDSASDHYKKRLTSDLSIASKGVLILWLDRSPEQGPDHMPFKLKAAGEALYLTSPDEQTLDSVEYTDAVTDQVFARFPDGSGEMILCATPTPGALNGSTCGG